MSDAVLAATARRLAEAAAKWSYERRGPAAEEAKQDMKRHLAELVAAVREEGDFGTN